MFTRITTQNVASNVSPLLCSFTTLASTCKSTLPAFLDKANKGLFNSGNSSTNKRKNHCTSMWHNYTKIWAYMYVTQVHRYLGVAKQGTRSQKLALHQKAKGRGELSKLKHLFLLPYPQHKPLPEFSVWGLAISLHHCTRDNFTVPINTLQ